MKRLDKILKQWAQQHDSEEEKLDSLTQDIMARIENLPLPEKEEEPVSPVFMFRKVRWDRLVLATLSVCLLCVVWFHYSVTQDQVARPKPVPPQQMTPSHQWMKYATLNEYTQNKSAKIYDEISRLFPGQIKWIKQTNGELDFELLSTKEKDAVADEYVTVRFVVMKKSGGGDWLPQQVTDITAASEEVVKVPLNQQMGAMQFWVHKLPDGLFALDSEVISARAEKGLATYGGVIKPGQSQVVFELEGQGAKYKIVQTIRRLCRINEKDCG